MSRDGAFSSRTDSTGVGLLRLELDAFARGLVADGAAQGRVEGVVFAESALLHFILHIGFAFGVELVDLVLDSLALG